MEITIKDFPDETYIRLDENFKKELMKEVNEINLETVSKKLGVSKTTVIEWKKRADYIPLGALKKLLELLNKDFKILDNKIVSYGTKKSKLYIQNPILPIKDSKELREILVHMMCDGCYNKENGYAAYYNWPIEPKEEFVKELNNCFGDANVIIHKDHVHLPTAAPLLLMNFFNISFNSKKCRIPQQFFNGNREQLSAIIRAAIIDEGTIDGSNVRIDSCNKEFLEDLKKICQNLGYLVGNTWKSNGPIYRFNILAKSLKQLNKDLGDLPIKKKKDLMNIGEINQIKDWKYKLPGEVKVTIMNELLNGQKRNIELILKLKLSKTTSGSHLRWLIKKNLINRKIEKNKIIYFIENIYKAKKFIKNPSEFMQCNKINNYGVSQLKLLKLVNEKSMKYNELRKIFYLSNSAFFKLISSLKNKKMIIKHGKEGWEITNNGRNILKLDEQEARYKLYSNFKVI